VGEEEGGGDSQDRASKSSYTRLSASPHIQAREAEGIRQKLSKTKDY